MNGDFVIRSDGLGKKYVIGHNTAAQSTNLRDAISKGFVNLGRTTRDMLHGRPVVVGDEVEEFWALRNVGFEIHQGDTVGIIGRNGAGKSTLLKVLSRITEPTEGEVRIKGRVASLLEVGTGFHLELTGRENIYLNGAILGMSRAEIRRKFDEIVNFSGVEQFLDTPVKRYSSGMSVRLAFAVAAFLEPEILIVDEVLAVGDAEFQRKCLGKMKDVACEGRTVLFVSHNMAAVQALCSRCIEMRNGQVVQDSEDVGEAIARYLAHEDDATSDGVTLKSHGLSISNVRIQGERGDVRSTIARGEKASVALDVSLAQANSQLNIGYALHDVDGTTVWWSFMGDLHGKYGIEAGNWTLQTDLPTSLLNDGRHKVEIIAANFHGGWLLPPGGLAAVINLDVQPGNLGCTTFANSKRAVPVLKPCFAWALDRADPDA